MSLRSRRLSRSIGPAVALAVAVVIVSAAWYTPAHARRAAAPGVSFRIVSSTKISLGDTATGQEDEIMRGRGIAVGDHARIELLVFSPLPDNTTLDDYLLALDSGRVVVVRPRNQSYSEASDRFGGPGIVALSRSGGGGRGFGGGGPLGGGGGGGGGGAGGRGGRGGGGGPPGGGDGAGARGARGGGRGRGGGFLAGMQLRDVKFEIKKLGAADSIEGRATQRFRITADYRIVWSGQSVDAHAVSDIITTTLPTAIPNPFEPLPYVENIPDGPMFEYILKLIRIRSQVEGVPIKVTTSTVIKGIDQVTGLPLGGARGGRGGGGGGGEAGPPTTVVIFQATAITGIKEIDVDPTQLAIPAGYRGPGGN